MTTMNRYRVSRTRRDAAGIPRFGDSCKVDAPSEEVAREMFEARYPQPLPEGLVEEIRVIHLATLGSTA